MNEPSDALKGCVDNLLNNESEMIALNAERFKQGMTKIVAKIKKEHAKLTSVKGLLETYTLSLIFNFKLTVRCCYTLVMRLKSPPFQSTRGIWFYSIHSP